MFGFRKLDVYQCAVAALPLAYSFADRADADTKRQLKRSALSINLNIAEGTGRCENDQRQFYRIARGSALETAAVLDALEPALLNVNVNEKINVNVNVNVNDVRIPQARRLPMARIVAMLTRLTTQHRVTPTTEPR